MKVLVTDANYSHSMAIQSYLQRFDRSLRLVAHAGYSRRAAWLGKARNTRLIGGSLESVLRDGDFDMVIPVGAVSVMAVATICPEKGVLPSLDKVQLCMDKQRTIEVAREVGVPCPRTWVAGGAEAALADQVGFPCVIKSRNESRVKQTTYAANSDELLEKYAKLSEGSDDAGIGPPLIQEYVSGAGVGFFALYDRGVAKWIFMHRRLREWPLTGGASTAATAFYHPVLRDYGIRLLDRLGWHGVAMVEFKYDPARETFHLMEINPKFWGSTELALRAGVNFPEGLVRVFRGETLGYSEQYDRNQRFYWPLPYDLKVLWKNRQLSSMREYFGPNSATDLWRSPLLALLNLGRALFR